MAQLSKYLCLLAMTLCLGLVVVQPALAQRVDQLPLLHQQQMMMGRPMMGPQAAPSASMLAAPAQPESPAPLPPPPTDSRIIAVVNDNVITSTDIENRLRIAFLSSGLPNRPEVREKLLPQILRSLIDEQLELQEAKRLDITVSKTEIDEALAHIAKDNNIPIDMRTYVAEHGIPPKALEDQIRAGLAWNHVIQRELRPRVEVGDDEVQAALDRIRANAGKEEYLTSEIFLAVDNPKDEDQVRQFADHLVEQLKAGGNFNAVARQFSQGTGAAAGGDIGWIQEGQLSPELDKVLKTLHPNEISAPVRTANGYHILGVREKRTVAVGDPKEITLSLQQAFHPIAAGTDKAALLQQAGQIRKTITTCDSLKADLAQKFSGWTWQDMGTVKLDRAPAWLSDNVRGLQIGSGGEPIATDKGALIVFLCGKHTPDDSVNREAIVNAIGTEKLELQARRLLRDLRRDAYLDIRVGQSPS